MEKFIIKGGKKLAGSVKIGGAKNAALPIMAASLLAPGNHILRRVPRLRDVHTMKRLLEHLGCEVTWEDSMHIRADHLNFDEAPYDVVKTMRASVLAMGALVGRMRHARISLPGGCAIGARPINLHLKALEQMGADIHLEDGYIEVVASRLKGAQIELDTVTVTGTENIMMAAVMAQGTTVILNAAREPEVVDLAQFLIAMGADIEGAGTDKLVIHGVPQLNAATHDIVADRIETGTFMMAAAITGGDIVIQDAPVEFLQTCTARLEDAGVRFEGTSKAIRVIGPERLKSVDITTSPHPGFATDLQAQFSAMMTIADGTSIITETIFENRFMHMQELARMGADVSVDGGTAVIKGVDRLNGAPVMATDLRASASLVLAGLAAQGTTVVDRIYHIDRGYERIEERLRTLGADIERSGTDH